MHVWYMYKWYTHVVHFVLPLVVCEYMEESELPINLAAMYDKRCVFVVHVYLFIVA